SNPTRQLPYPKRAPTPSATSYDSQAPQAASDTCKQGASSESISTDSTASSSSSFSSNANSIDDVLSLCDLIHISQDFPDLLSERSEASTQSHPRT
ncbi:hypothetical protein PFISCL1PPCAC_11448, partial [Pristionchus fissidentatus]